VRGTDARCLGTSAANPPRRYARIQSSSVERPTCRKSPDGCACNRSANKRTNAPRSAGEIRASNTEAINP
jgi:hypothetical protein